MQRLLEIALDADIQHPCPLARPGQRAFGDCQGLIASTNRNRDYTCRNTPGLGPDQMTLTRVY